MLITQSAARGRRRHRLATRRSSTLLTFATIIITFVLWDGASTQLTTAVQPSGSDLIATPSTATTIASPISEVNAPCSVVLETGDVGDSCVAFVQAVPGLDAVDLSIGTGGGATATNVAYGEYVDFIATPTDEDVTVQITNSVSPEALIADESLSLLPDVAYVVILEQAYDEGEPTLSAVPIDLAPLGPEESRLAFHHSVTDADALSILGFASPSDEEITPGATTDQIIVDSGASDVDVVPANNRDDILATLNLQLEPKLSYLLIVGGSTSDQSVSVIYTAAPVAAGT